MNISCTSAEGVNTFEHFASKLSINIFSCYSVPKFLSHNINMLLNMNLKCVVSIQL